MSPTPPSPPSPSTSAPEPPPEPPPGRAAPHPEPAPAGPSPRVRRLGAEDRRDELLAAAHAVALAGGLDAVTAPEVGTAAHASRALVFHYFGSTAELRRAVASVAIDALDAALDATGTPASGDVPDQAARRRVVQTLVDTVVAHRRVWVDIWAGALREDEPTVERLDALRGRLFARVAQLRADPSDARLDLVAAGWVAFVEAVIARWLAGDPREHGGGEEAPSAAGPGAASVDRAALEDLVVDSMSALLGPARPADR